MVIFQFPLSDYRLPWPQIQNTRLKLIVTVSCVSQSAEYFLNSSESTVSGVRVVLMYVFSIDDSFDKWMNGSDEGQLSHYRVLKANWRGLLIIFNPSLLYACIRN